MCLQELWVELKEGRCLLEDLYTLFNKFGNNVVSVFQLKQDVSNE